MNTAHKILDIFENFLEEKGVWIENEDREDGDNEAILYGMDYGFLYEEINELLTTENLKLDDGEYTKHHVSEDVNQICIVVRNAIDDYGSNHVDVYKNPMTQMYDVMICTRNNSFAYMESVGRMTHVDENELEHELNKLGVCLMPF